LLVSSQRSLPFPALRSNEEYPPVQSPSLLDEFKEIQISIPMTPVLFVSVPAFLSPPLPFFRLSKKPLCVWSLPMVLRVIFLPPVSHKRPYSFVTTPVPPRMLRNDNCRSHLLPDCRPSSTSLFDSLPIYVFFVGGVPLVYLAPSFPLLAKRLSFCEPLFSLRFNKRVSSAPLSRLL